MRNLLPLPGGARVLLLAASFLVLITGVALADDDLFVPGGEGDGPSRDAAVSADGRFVTFASEATNLVSDDNNELSDVFVHDRQTGDTARVSLGADEQEANGYSEVPALSADGRFVAFHSAADNLVPADNNMDLDVFVYDRQAGTTARVSVASDGAQAAGGSYRAALSADGRLVAFVSTAVNLDPRDADPQPDVYVHDRQSGATELISVNRQGTAAAGFAGPPALSVDGRFVAFSSASSDLVAGDENDFEDVFVHDRQTGQTTRVSVRSDGDEVFADSYDPALSADGRFVAFWSYATELTDDPDLSGWNVYVHDRQMGATTLISRGMGGPADGGSIRPRLSADARVVVFESQATNLTVTPDANGLADIFAHDRQTGQTTLLSLGAAGPGDGESQTPAITPDGRYVVFHSGATNLVSDDNNGTTDVFIRDRTAGMTGRVSLAAAELTPVDALIYLPAVIR